MSAAVIAHVKSKGVKFADAADAAGAILKIASERSINGIYNLHYIVVTVNSYTFSRPVFCNRP